MLKIASEKKLLSEKTVGVDSTALEADAAMTSIVRMLKAEESLQAIDCEQSIEEVAAD
ncbi:MAG TPA: hypothetical protein VL132_19610 [Planctomycetaceae bacterium]|nr:hypothetical protein [Planctomycetaceae bacterium]